MLKTIRQMKRRQDGIAAVEFAIVLPVLILILFGITEFGLVLFNQQVITNASREGARYGIVSQDPRVSFSDIKDRVNDYCEDYLIPPGTPTTNVSNTGTAFQDDLTVDVSYLYDFIVLPMDPINLRAKTVMKYE